jgi:exonuclease III
MSIIQWNCRGVKPNYEEIKSLLCDHCPIAVCLQETFLKDTDNISFKGYDFYSITSVSQRDGRAIGGSAILVKKGIPHECITLNSNLQAVAVNISLHKMINFCSIYIPSSHTVTTQELDNLFNQLPSACILLGDFNAHNDIWGCSDINGSGQAVEDFIGRHGLCLLNDKSNTYLHPATGSFSAIDLTLCSPTVFMDLQWSVGKDQCGSDHFPIFVEVNSPDIENKNPKWLLHKADWTRFQELSAVTINREVFENGSDLISSFATSLTEVALETIPKSSTNSKHVHKPWFNEECKAAVRQRKKTLDKFKVSPTHANLASYKRARANARRVIKERKRNSWRQYVNRLNSRSSVKKAWDMVRKISGKEYCSSSSHLDKPDGSRATENKDIANTLAEAFEMNSSTGNYTEKFKRFKAVKERKPHDFRSNNEESYNDLFSLKELKDSLDKTNDSAVGPDDVHYQLLKHLPEVSLNVLLDIFNHIWVDGNFPDSWRQATVIPIPKPGKDATNPTHLSSQCFD